MKLFKLFFTLVAGPVVLAACAPASVRTEQVSEVKAGHFEISEAVTTARHGNAVEMLYFNPDNRLVLRHPDGAEQVLSEDKDGDVRLAYATLHSDGKALYALWRPKLAKSVEGVGEPGDKLIRVRTSLDGGKSFGRVHRLNQKGGAFAPLVASNGLGDVYVAYTDERNAGIDLYLNLSHARGEDWKKEDLKLNDDAQGFAAVNPSLVADGNRVYASWMSRGADEQFKLVVRSSEDKGEHWLAPVVAHSSPTQPGTPVMVKITSGLLLCWSDVDAVRCKRSSDQNKEWSEAVAVKDTDGTEGVFLYADPKGKAHLLIAKKPVGDEKKRINLFHVLTSDGALFSSPQRLSGGTLYGASTILPQLSFGDDDSVMAAWVDMRYVRPTIGANYSADGGVTWLAQPLVMAGKSGMFNYFPSVSYAGGGKYQVAWEESPNRSIPTTVIGTRGYQPGGNGVQMPPPDVARLKERIDAFWTVREADKWDLAYDFLDPFFREANSRQNYVKTQGLVKYYAHRLAGEPQITEQTAAAPVAFTSEVPEVMLKGKKISVPKNEVEISQEWVWLDGEWYHVFRDLMNNSQLPD